MNIKKVIHLVLPGGNGGTVLISSWNCNYSIYLDIQVYYLDIRTITSLFLPSIGSLCIGSFYSFIFYLTTTFLNVTFSGTQKPIPPTVFNLQASDWVHCEEETGAHKESLWQNYKLESFFFTNF